MPCQRLLLQSLHSTALPTSNNKLYYSDINNAYSHIITFRCNSLFTWMKTVYPHIQMAVAVALASVKVYVRHHNKGERGFSVIFCCWFVLVFQKLIISWDDCIQQSPVFTKNGGKKEIKNKNNPVSCVSVCQKYN